MSMPTVEYRCKCGKTTLQPANETVFCTSCKYPKFRKMAQAPMSRATLDLMHLSDNYRWGADDILERG